jgi:hypothetical protein
LSERWLSLIWEVANLPNFKYCDPSSKKRGLSKVNHLARSRKLESVKFWADPIVYHNFSSLKKSQLELTLAYWKRIRTFHLVTNAIIGNECYHYFISLASCACRECRLFWNDRHAGPFHPHRKGWWLKRVPQAC